MFLIALLCLLLASVHSATVSRRTFDKIEESSGIGVEDEEESGEDEKLGISALLERANKDIEKNLSGPLIVEGDIALPYGLQSADPCTARGCLWPKATDGNVYVPYQISNQYSTREREIIINGLRSFAESTCIRFFARNRNDQRDFVNIQSQNGCFSFVGRRGRGQVVSLDRRGCVFQSIVQHELLHALGFNHEQTRSDRDQHVRILLQNVQRGTEYNFRKIEDSRNLGTPYDYGSVMHYDRFAFSRNRQPTIVPIPNPNVTIGRAQQMSATDILRVNRLYQCRRELEKTMKKEEEN